MKFCKDCKYYKVKSDTMLVNFPNCCYRTIYNLYDLITGESMTGGIRCAREERGSNYLCGEKGKYWEAKDEN